MQPGIKLNGTMSNNPYYSAPSAANTWNQQNAWNQQRNPYGQPGYAGGPVQPIGQPQVPRQSRRRNQAKLGLTYAIGYVVVIWAVHLVNVIVFGGDLVYFGIHPLEPASLPFIFTSPILHVNFEHLISNTVPGAIFAFLVGYSGHRVFWEVTAFVVIVGGLGTWVLGGPGTNHVGASMLVYGWLAYLLVRGIFNRSASQIALGVVLGLTYSGLIWGVLPINEGVSWQAHLFGGLGGVAAGVLITSDDPPALQARKTVKQQQKRAK